MFESDESLRTRRGVGGEAAGDEYAEVRDWREGVMEGSRTSWGAGPSFSKDTLRPVEFLPDKASILCTRAEGEGPKRQKWRERV
jgi:hypothetical protein